MKRHNRYIKLRMKQSTLCALLFLLVLIGCEKFRVEEINTTSNKLVIPEGFPDVDFPEDNAFSNARWELGKRLFFDPILSIDSSISCGSCHKPNIAFSDNMPFSPGVYNRPGVRNSSTLANVAYHPYFLREGSVPTLEMQVLVPIQEHNEFNHNIVTIAQQLNWQSSYVTQSQEAYGRNPDAFVITRALATFQRTLLSGNSLYDQYLNGNNSALSEDQKRGLDLFFGSKTNCTDCHNGFNFTEYTFENNGLYETYTDIGRMRFTNDSADFARFKTPTLRNIEFTGPYMHDGSMVTLEEIIEHYDSGGKAFPNKSLEITPLGLSAQEKSDLVAFLKSLSDPSFMSDSRWE